MKISDYAIKYKLHLKPRDNSEATELDLFHFDDVVSFVTQNPKDSNLIEVMRDNMTYLTFKIAYLDKAKKINIFFNKKNVLCEQLNLEMLLSEFKDRLTEEEFAILSKGLS